jgi:hypothetical protein
MVAVSHMDDGKDLLASLAANNAAELLFPT